MSSCALSLLHIIFSLLMILAPVVSIENIRFAFEMSRHGVTSPSVNSTKDYKDVFGESWKGLNEVSLVGLRQQYVLGYYNRLRYIDNKLLKETYDPRDVYVIANNKNCTLQSANAQLQGLYPPSTGIELTEKQKANANPPNDAIDGKYYENERNALRNYALPDKMHLLPVHAFYLQDHTFELQDSSYCPSVASMQQTKESSQQAKDLLTKFQSTYGDKILPMIGQTDKSIFDNYSYTKSLIETIIAEKADGRSMTHFTKAGININELLSFSNEFITYDLMGYSHDQLVKLSQYAMSPTFEKIINWLSIKVSNDLKGNMDIVAYSSPKFVLYLTYAPSMIIFQQFMLLFNETPFALLQLPQYSSSAIIELISIADKPSSEDDYQIVYRFDNIEVYRVPYMKFIYKAKERIMTAEKIKEYCGWEEMRPSFNYWIIIVIVLGVISLSCVVVMIYMFVKKRTLN